MKTEDGTKKHNFWHYMKKYKDKKVSLYCQK